MVRYLDSKDRLFNLLYLVGLLTESLKNPILDTILYIECRHHQILCTDVSETTRREVLHLELRRIIPDLDRCTKIPNIKKSSSLPNTVTFEPVFLRKTKSRTIDREPNESNNSIYYVQPVNRNTNHYHSQGIHFRIKSNNVTRIVLGIITQ